MRATTTLSRAAVVTALLLVLAWPLVVGPVAVAGGRAGSSLTVPAAVAQWFDEHGVKAAREDASDMLEPEQMPQGLDGITLGSPYPSARAYYPEYDLHAKRVVGDGTFQVEGSTVVDYCALATIPGSTSGMIECAKARKNGTVVSDTAGTTGAILPVPVPVDIILLYPYLGYVGVSYSTQQVVALESDARKAMGAEVMPAKDFMTAVGKDLAEMAAIQRLNGPQDGGGGSSPFVRTASEQERRDALVAQALALPDDLTWHEGEDFQAVLARRQAAQSASASPTATAAAARDVVSSWGSRGWFVLAVGMVVLVAVGGVMLGVLRRRRRRAPRPTSERVPSAPESTDGAASPPEDL